MQLEGRMLSQVEEMLVFMREGPRGQCIRKEKCWAKCKQCCLFMRGGLNEHSVAGRKNADTRGKGAEEY